MTFTVWAGNDSTGNPDSNENWCPFKSYLCFTMKFLEVLLRGLPGRQSGKPIKDLPGTFDLRVYRKTRNPENAYKNRKE